MSTDPYDALLNEYESKAAPKPALAPPTRRPRTKPGVRLDGVDPSLINFAAERDFTITSGRDARGVHAPRSRHGGGGALDLRTRDKTPEEIARAISEANAAGYHAKFERKGQGRATGDHIHLSRGLGLTPPAPKDDYDKLLDEMTGGAQTAPAAPLPAPPVSALPPPQIAQPRRESVTSSADTDVRLEPTQPAAEIPFTPYKADERSRLGRAAYGLSAMTRSFDNPPDAVNPDDVGQAIQLRVPATKDGPPPNYEVSLEVARQISPDMARAVEGYKRETGRDLLQIGPKAFEGRLIKDPKGDYYDVVVSPTRAQIEVANAYNRGGLAAAEEVASRITEQRKAYVDAYNKSLPERKAHVTGQGPVERAVVAGEGMVEDAMAGYLHTATNISALASAMYTGLRHGWDSPEYQKLNLSEQGTRQAMEAAQGLLQAEAKEQGSAARIVRGIGSGVAQLPKYMAGGPYGAGVIAAVDSADKGPRAMVEEGLKMNVIAALGDWAGGLQNPVARQVAGRVTGGAANVGAAALQGERDPRALAEQFGIGAAMSGPGRARERTLEVPRIAPTERTARRSALDIDVDVPVRTLEAPRVVRRSAEETIEPPQAASRPAQSPETARREVVPAEGGIVLPRGGAENFRPTEIYSEGHVDPPYTVSRYTGDRPDRFVVHRRGEPRPVAEGLTEAQAGETAARLNRESVRTPPTPTEARQKFLHRDFGFVEVAENQSGVPQGKVRVVSMSDGSEHMMQKANGRGQGNNLAVPVREAQRAEEANARPVDISNRADSGDAARSGIGGGLGEQVDRQGVRGDSAPSVVAPDRLNAPVPDPSGTPQGVTLTPAERSKARYVHDGDAASADSPLRDAQGSEYYKQNGLWYQRNPEGRGFGAGWRTITDPQFATKIETWAARNELSAPAPTPKAVKSPLTESPPPLPRPANGRTAERSFPQSAESAGLSKATNRTYEVVADADSVSRASKRIESQGAEKVELALRSSEAHSKDDIVAAQLLARKYSEAGDHEREVAVINDLAEKLTKAGQTVQAASLISRLSPEGVLIQGQRILNKRGANRKLTAEEATSLKESAAKAREAEAKVSDLQRQIEELKLRPAKGQVRSRPKLETLTDRLNKLESEARARLDARKAAGSEKGAVALNRGTSAVNALTGERVAGRKATETPEFKRWSENAPVVEKGHDYKTGESVVVKAYHGTREDFTKFSASRAGQNTQRHPGRSNFFLSDSPENAGGFATGSKDAIEDFHPNDRPNVMPVYLRMKNPLVVDAEGKSWYGIMDDAISGARRAGHDGLIVRNVRDLGDMRRIGAEPTTTLVAFKPEQIKSATGNSGKFDPANKSILGASTIPLDIADYAIIGAAKLAKKGVSVASWTDEMVREFGEEIRPQLRRIYQASFQQLKDERAALRRESQERAVRRENPDVTDARELQRLAAKRIEAQRQAQAARRDLERTFHNLSRTRGEKALDTGTSLRRANLLTAAKTHLRNITSNALFQGTEELSRPLAAVGDMIAKRKTGQRTTSGLNITAAAKATIAAALTEGPARAKDIMLGREVLPLEGYRPGAESSDSKMQLHESETGSRILDAYVNTVYRSLTAEDAVFKVYAFRRELQDIAKSQALNERARDPKVNVRERTRELLADPTEAMLIEASTYADYATFQNQNVVSQAIAQGKRILTEKAGPLPKFAIESIAPFDRTPTNIIARTIENSPAGFISAAMKYKRIGKKAAAEELAGRIADEAFTRQEQKDFARTFGRASTGTILSVLGMALAHKELLSGASDYDTDKADYMEKRRKFGGGGMLKIPGTNQYVSIIDTPAGKAMAVAAGIYEQMTKKGERVTADSKTTGSAKLALNVVTDQPLLRGLRDMAGSRSVGEGVGNYASSYVPASAALKAGAELLDPNARVYRGQGFSAPFRMLLPPQVPGGRGGLPVDSGQDVGERGGFGRRALRAVDPFNTTTEGRGPTKRKKGGASSSAPKPPTPSLPKPKISTSRLDLQGERESRNAPSRWTAEYSAALVDEVAKAGSSPVTDEQGARVARMLDGLDDRKFADFARNLDEHNNAGALQPLETAATYAAEYGAEGLARAVPSRSKDFRDLAGVARALRLLAQERAARPVQFTRDALEGKYGEKIRAEVEEGVYYPQNHLPVLPRPRVTR